jgi:hypothetical protein
MFKTVTTIFVRIGGFFAVVVGVIIAHTILIYSISVGAPDSNGVSACTTLKTDFELEEAATSDLSSDSCWWLNSGASFSASDGIARTLQGPIYRLSPWRGLYAKSDSIDTDEGWYPQNLFRLISKNAFENVEQRLYGRIQSYRLSTSPNRNATNGIFLLARYADSNNLYMAGLRVDGTAVIKRKAAGVYETIGTAVFNDIQKYDRNKNPNALTLGQWMGIGMRVQNREKDVVVIQLDLDLSGEGDWQTVLSVIDRPLLKQGDTLVASGSVGVRTDFMDAEFKDYQITHI